MLLCYRQAMFTGDLWHVLLKTFFFPECSRGFIASPDTDHTKSEFTKTLLNVNADFTVCRMESSLIHWVSMLLYCGEDMCLIILITSLQKYKTKT